VSEDLPTYGTAQSDLQAKITALADFPDKPASDWVAQVTGSHVEVIAGAILTWAPRGGGVSGYTGDPNEPRRAAAQAILQARLSEEALSSTAQLRATIDDYQRKSVRQTTALLGLTVAIAVLTAVQIWIAWCAVAAVRP
jgi:hypothetical protein